MSVAVAAVGQRAGAVAADSRVFDLDDPRPKKLDKLLALEDRIVAFAGIYRYEGKDFGSVLFQAATASTARRLADDFLGAAHPEFGRAFAAWRHTAGNASAAELFFQAMVLWRGSDGLLLQLLWSDLADDTDAVSLDSYTLWPIGRRAVCEAIGHCEAIVDATEGARRTTTDDTNAFNGLSALLGPDDYRRVAEDLVQRSIDASPIFGESPYVAFTRPDIAESLHPVPLLGGPVVSATIEYDAPLDKDMGSALV